MRWGEGMKKNILIYSVFALVSCNTHGIAPEELPNASLQELCGAITGAAYGNASEEEGLEALRQLHSRTIFTEREMSAIANLQPTPGISEQAGLCAWGYYWYDVNETITSGATRRQYVFGDGNYVPHRYLYTENGIVVAIQQ